LEKKVITVCTFAPTTPLFPDVGEIKKEYSEELKKLEQIDRAIGFIFSRSGFTGEAEEYCQEKGIACSEDERWLETGK
jgi:hypothetical protein